MSVHGTDGSTYRLAIKAQDHITDCAAHAYGNAVISFLRSHACLGADRYLATTSIGTRSAILSVITLTLAPRMPDVNGQAELAQLDSIENGSGTGSINDLLRDGRSIDRYSGKIPANEAFLVKTAPADGGSRLFPELAIFDAWWASGTTQDQDPSLVAMESALFGTNATPFTIAPEPPTSDSKSAAIGSCRLWGAGIDAVQVAALHHAAANLVHDAASLDTRWSTLANAMSYLASLPENGLSQTQQRRASVEDPIVARICGALGIPLN
jgi:hypothetical protein